MTLSLGILAIVLTLAVALYSERESLPRKYKLMLWAAAIATIIQSVWGGIEQEKFEKSVLGGNSFVYLGFETIDGSSSKFVLNHGGEPYPVYDLDIEIYDMRKFVGVKTGDPRVIYASRQQYQRDAFGENLSASILNSLHPQDCYGYWAAIAQQRNGQVVNVIQARKIDGHWLSATRVYSLKGTKQELLGEFSPPEWSQSFAWPTVEIPKVGSVKMNAPQIACSASGSTA